MFASRWHSPPKPLPVLSCVTGTWRWARRSASREPCDVALQHADAQVAQAVAQQALEQRRLAGAGRAHDVEHRHAVAVEVVAVGARDRVVGVQRVLDDPDLHAVHPASSISDTSMDSTSSSSPLTTATSAVAAGRAAERRRPRSPSRASQPSQRSRAGTTSCSSRAPSQTVSRDDDPEGELQRRRARPGAGARSGGSRPSPGGRRRGAPRCRRRPRRSRTRASGLVGGVRPQLVERLGHERRARARRRPRPAASARGRRRRPRPARSR